MLTERRRIRVWFGCTPISDFVAAPDIAARYEGAMRKRFQSLRVTNDALPSLPDPATLKPLL